MVCGDYDVGITQGGSIALAVLTVILDRRQSIQSRRIEMSVFVSEEGR